jgi:hypothetical protein
MAGNVNDALKTFDVVMQRLDSGPPDPNAEPFRIRDYTEAAVQLDAAAQRLQELLLTFDRIVGSTNLARLTAQVAPAVEHAESRGKGVVDYAFRKLLLLAVLTCGAVMATVLATRYVTARILRTERNP